MTVEILLRYIHFISIFAIVATLTSEHLLLKKQMTRAEIGRVAMIDAIYGFAAMTLVAAGLTLWLGSFGKPAVYYSNNWIFIIKISLVGAIAVLSIYPTIFFIRNRKGHPQETVIVPQGVIGVIRLELVLLLIIPLLAGLMAGGVGYFGG